MRFKPTPSTSSERLWYWEIQRARSGPHYYLTLEWAPRDAASLRSAALEMLPADFGPWENPERPEVWMHQKSGDWGWTEIEFGPGSLLIGRGWGGIEDSETAIIHQLLALPLDFTHWRVFSGGDGYATCYYRSGADHDSFLAYLRTEPAPPDFEAVKQQLIRLLAAHGWEEKYRIGEEKWDAGQLRITLLHEVSCLDGPWEWGPEPSELDQLAREVCDRCALPVMASTASLHAPDDLLKTIGSTIYFGTGQSS